MISATRQIKQTLCAAVAALVCLTLVNGALGQSGCGNPPQPPPPCPCPPCPTGGSGNPYHPFSGSTLRKVPDMALAHTVGAETMHWTRMTASRWSPFPFIAHDTPFGDAANWRHSWQWSILDAGSNANEYSESIRIIYPNGFYGNFAKDSPTAPHMTFLADTQERVLKEGTTNYYLMFVDGSKYHFSGYTSGTSKLYRIERLIDHMSNSYSFAYATGLLTQVTGPNTNQSIRIHYSALTNSQPPGNIQFTYVDGMATQVLLAGLFNSWSGQAMSVSGGSNWTTTINLTNGFHQYKFITRYTTAQVWRLDPGNNLWCYDDTTNFNKNSVAVIDPYRVISSVELSDGRTTTYSYGWVEGISLVHILLTRATYGDGTYADYSYYHPSNDVWRRPLLRTADDPHYEGPARAIRYLYQTNVFDAFTNVYSGQIYEEQSLVNSQLLSRLIIPTDSYLRLVVNGVGETNSFLYTDTTGQIGIQTNGVGYVTSNEYFGSNGMLYRSTDAKGRTTVFSRTLHFGAVLSISNANGSCGCGADVINQYTDTNYPFYLLSTTDKGGRTTSYTRDTQNRPTRVDYPDGSFETNAYNANGQLIAKRQRDGTIWTYSYDSRGLKTSETNPLGFAMQFVYDSHDRLASVSNALGYVTRYAYNWRGLVTNAVYSDGSEEKTWYDSYGMVTQRLDRAGGYTVRRYDDLGHLTAEVSSMGATNRYNFDVEGRLVGITLPLGLTLSNTYDAIGRKVRETYSSDATFNEWHYDPDGVRTQINRLGGVSLLTYNDDRQVAAMRDPLERWTSYGYDATGNRTHVTNALNEVMIYTFDAMDRQTSSRDCSGSVVSNFYDGLGRLIGQVDANGIVSSNVFDATGSLLASWRGGRLVVSNTYNEIGWTVLRRNADGLVVSNTYDTAGRLQRTYLPDESYSENQYSNTYLVKSIDRAGRNTLYQRDAQGRITNQMDNATNNIKYRYDAAGNLTDLIDQSGNITTFRYDNESRQTAKIYADGITNTYSYDAMSRLTSKLDGNGITTTFRYDAVGSLTNIDYATDTDVFFGYDALNRMTLMVDGVGTSIYSYAGSCTKVGSVDGPFANDTISYGYDSGKRLVSITSVQSVVQYSFDALDRITAVVADGKTNAYTYIANGRLPDALTLGNGVLTDYAYDPLFRLTNLIHQSGTTNIASFAYTYNDADLRTSVVLGDVTPSSRSVAYDYDPIGQLASAQGSFSGYNFDYSYDPAGNPTRQNNNGFVLSNSFNNLNQNTTSLWSGAMTVLGTANMTNGIVTVNGVVSDLRADSVGGSIFTATNQPIITGTNTFTAILTDPFGRKNTNIVSTIARNSGYGYDKNGNLTNDGQFVYVWDNADRLKEVHKGSNVVMTCKYDGLSRRRERIISSISGGGDLGSTNRYIYHDWLVVAVTDASTNVLETYTHGVDVSGSLGGAGGIGGILSCSSGSTSRWFHYDGNGNLIRATDTTRTIVSSLEYGPFGTVLTKSGTYTPRYQFSSKEFDSTVGLNYYGYRFYSSQLGRWPSRDPLGDVAFLKTYSSGNVPIIFNPKTYNSARASQLYTFINNNSINDIDAIGLIGLAQYRCDTLTSQSDIFFGYICRYSCKLVSVHGSCCPPPPAKVDSSQFIMWHQKEPGGPWSVGCPSNGYDEFDVCW